MYSDFHHEGDERVTELMLCALLILNPNPVTINGLLQKTYDGSDWQAMTVDKLG